MHGGPWHVLHVSSNHEKRVAKHLSVRSVEHYLPLYSERVQWTDRTRITERPLFTGYVFTRFSPQDRISVISTPGVLRLLGEGEKDMVSSEELDRIQTALASGMILRPHLGVSVGTSVRIRCGAFAGVEGIVTEIRHRCKVIINLSAARQSFLLEAPLDDLDVLSAPLPKQGLRTIAAFS